MTSDDAPQRWAPWVLALLAAAVAFALGRCAPTTAPQSELGQAPGDRHGVADTDGARETWTCSMHPQIRRSEPGDCPICGMDLIPVGGGSDVDDRRVVLSERASTLAQIQTVKARRIAAPGVDVRLLGRVEEDESRSRSVSAWISGRVDKLSVRETGTTVKRGQVVATLYSPEIYAAHQDLISAAKQVKKLESATALARNASEASLAAARERLSLLGVPDAEIDRMQGDTKPRKSIPIRTSYGGTVVDRLVTQGQYIETGAVLYRIVDLSRVWVQLDAYESDLSALMEGQTVEIEVEALPGETFKGEVAFIDPIVDPRRRVTKVRVEVDNPDRKLSPGMFVEAVVRGSAAGDGQATAVKQKPLVIPGTAPLFTGQRSVVYVQMPDTERPTYEPRQVELGPRMGELYPVVAGLSEGERVVVHGAFVLDADLQIRGGPSMMSRAADDDDAVLPHERIDVSPELKAALVPVVRSYLELQTALADDDWGASKSAAESLHQAVLAVDEQGVAQDDETWTDVGPTFLAKAKLAAESTAIEDARGAFLDLSQAIKHLLRVYGNPLDEPLRLAYCPMANANDGAEWVQTGTDVDNSYFGESMLSCGEIRATVDPGQYLLMHESVGASQVGGHRH